MGGTEAPKALFPRLTGGPGGIGRSQTERHQRGRLEGAMVSAVSKHGYAETTVGELVGLAGVSKSTFYEHFDSKEECFLSTFETIVEEASSRVALAYRSRGARADSPAGLEESLAAAFTRFAEIVEEEAVPATLVVVDSLTLGRAALDQRQRGFEAFERMIHQSFRQAPGQAQPSDLAVRVLVAGVWTVVYRCLRAGCPEELADHLEQIVGWALSYRDPITLPPTPPRPTSQNGEVDPEAVDWNEPPDSPPSREFLSQRDRIVRAAAQAGAETGYANLTIPAISATAGTSNQTFYEHFDSKEEAFLAAFEELSERSLAATWAAAATQTEWAATIEAGMRGLLEHIVAEPLFAKLAFFELPAAGAVALDHADAAIRRFTGFLDPRALPPDIDPLPPVVVEALGGGAWQAIQHEIAVGDLDRLPDFAPELTAVMLTPLLQAR